MTTERLLTIKEVANRAAISTRQLRRRCDAGEFPKPITQGRSIRWFESDLEEYFDKLKSQRA